MDPTESNPRLENPAPEITDVAAPAAPPEAAPKTAENDEGGNAKGSGGETAWETLRSLLVVLIGVLCIRTFVAEATVIPTGSMERTILVGDHVFLNKLLYGPRLPYTSWRIPPIKEVRRGDIVAFHYPRNPSLMYVKRAIAVGGDVVRITNKRVYVDGKLLREPYAEFQSTYMIPLRDNFPPPISQIDTLPAAWGLDPGWAREMPNYIRDDGLHVPDGYLFAMGDNRDNSQDSRFWGFVPLDNVVGEPLFVYWSYDAPTKDWTADDLAGRLRFDWDIVLNFIRKTRWSRTGKSFTRDATCPSASC